MHRSDRIYLSKFAFDRDPEYLELDDFDLDDFGLDGKFDSDEFYDENFQMMKKSSSTGIRRLQSNED